MLNGGGQVTMPQNPNHQPSSGAHRNYPAEIRIIEQPAQKSLRFRYECEGRSAGSIPGASSTPENKKFPEIQIVGCDPSLLKQAVVVVSCVTKDPPYEAHPHNLVGRDNCKDGVCTVHIPPETMRVEFQNLGIQCVKKRDIEKSLSVREKLKVDPFKRGFAHKNQPTSIDLNAVRLCFQVFYMSPDNQNGNRGGKFNALRPVVSNIIYDKKAMSEMTIVKLSDCVTYVDGGNKDIILLCEKVAKEDIEVHFFEENDAGLRVWEDKADFQPTQVHKQTAIWFRAPRYRNIEVTEPVKAFIQLYRPSDRATSEALQFQFLPLDSVVNGNSIKRKRSAYEDPLNKLRGSLEGQESMINQIMHTTQQYLEPIKTEPRDTVSPLSAHGGISPYGGGILYQAPGTSPYLAASPSASPHYYASPSPDSMNYRYRQEPVNVQGNFDVQMQKEDSTWNIPFQPPNQAPQEYHFNVPAAPPVNDQQIYDLDKHQINSGEVQSLVSQMNIPNMLLADNLSLSDLDINTNPNNTSDSLTNILNEAAKKNLGC